MASVQPETPEEKSFRKDMEAFESVLSAVSSATLPAGTDYHYYKTFESVSTELLGMQDRLRHLLHNFPTSRKVSLEVLKDPEEAFGWVVDALDELLEKVDKSVDEGSRLILEERKTKLRASQDVGAQPQQAQQVAGMRYESKSRRQQEWLDAQNAAGDSLRPQKEFHSQMDNSNQTFKGVLDHWKGYLQGGDALPVRLAPYASHFTLESGPDVPPHPLERVLDQMQYPSSALCKRQPLRYQGLDVAPVTLVETEEQLRQLAASLEGALELAVDLEHHSFRSFQGFTCLMQISDRNQDWLVDTLKLRHLVGPALAPIFADPQVVKVLHGADWDVLWLQRDFGIYIANLFDTGQAARTLQHERFSLAHLLQFYCDIKADKKYQLADWRARPLSEEMSLYARMDTHYLLFIYDCLRAATSKVALQNELVDQGNLVPSGGEVEIPAGKPGGSLGTVLERSRQVCLQRYNKPLLRPHSHMEALLQSKGPPLSPSQAAVFAGLFRWRDQAARDRDESLDYVISKSQLFRLAKSAPADAKSFKAVMNGDNTPSLANKLSPEILSVIQSALDSVSEDQAKQLDVPEPSRAAESSQRATGVMWAGPALHAGLKPQQEANLPQVTIHQPAPNPAPPAPAILAPEASDRPSLAPDQFSSPPAANSFVAPEPASSSRQPPATPPADLPQKLAASSRAVQALTQLKPRGLLGAAVVKKKTSAFAKALASRPHSVESAAAKQVARDLQARMEAPLSVIVSSARASPAEAASVESEPLTGDAVRAAAEALRLENVEEVACPPAKSKRSSEEALGDYLPLPLSEQYPKRPRRLAQPEKSQGPSRLAQPSKVDNEEMRDVDEILRQAGLEGSDSEPEATRAVKKPRDSSQLPKKARLETAGKGSQELPAETDEQKAPAVEFSEIKDGELKRQGEDGKLSQSVARQRFDYPAALSAAPGLNLAHLTERHQGQRGRHGRGRTGRGRSTSQPESFSLYQIDDSKLVRGGKRSAVTQKSGNRSMTFGS